MDLPEFPTDNLYKFVTIFGLTLIIGGLALPVYQERYYAEENREFVSKMLTTVGEAFLALPTTTEQKASHKETIQLFDQLRQVITGSIALDSYARQVVLYWRIGVGMIVIGAGASIWGFYYWYHDHQKYHDMILRNQALGKGAKAS